MDACLVYDSRHAKRLPDNELPRGNTLVTIYFLMEGSVEEARNLSTLLDLFTDFSGLQINHTKSAFAGFGLAQEEE